MAIGYDTPVFIVANHAGSQYWLISAENQRDKNGRLILQGRWGSPAEAKPMSLELAAVYRRRFLEECSVTAHFTLSAGSKDYVEEPGSSSPSSGEDERRPMSYRGLLAVPGHDVKNDGQKCWFVRIYENGMQQDSVRGATVQEVVDRVYERNLQGRAEKVSIQSQASQAVAAPAKPAGPRIRPGDLRR